VDVETNSDARWLPHYFACPPGANVSFPLSFALRASVERTAVAARRLSPGTGQERPLLRLRIPGSTATRSGGARPQASLLASPTSVSALSLSLILPPLSLSF
jgi:hypothetical protein